MSPKITITSTRGEKDCHPIEVVVGNNTLIEASEGIDHKLSSIRYGGDYHNAEKLLDELRKLADVLERASYTK